MKYRLLKTGFICFVFGCYACTNKDIRRPGDIFFANENKLPESSISYRFIPLETRDDNLIGHISKVEIVDNRIFILDATNGSKLQVYDMDGRYIQQIGAKGNGPGEYVIPRNFYIDRQNQTITIVNPDKKQLLFYDLHSYSYKGSKHTPFNFFSCIPLPGGHYAWYSLSGFDRQRKRFYIRLTDDTFENTISYHCPANFISSYSLASQDVFYKTEEQSFFYLPYSPTIYKIKV